MNIVETALPGVLIIEPRVFGDARGFFVLILFLCFWFGAACFVF